MPTTVKELINILEKENPNTEIVMSKDAEGNDFSHLADVGDGLCVREEGGYLSIYNLDEKKEAGKSAKKVLVLWPV